MDLAFWLPLLLLLSVLAILFAGYSVAFTLAGGSLLFAVLAAAMGHFEWRLLQALPSRIYNLFGDDTLISVPLFVLMGTILDRTKVAADLLETMGLALRRIPGGIGVSVCLVGALLGASTGVIGATVVTMAMISLPTMLRFRRVDASDPAGHCPDPAWRSDRQCLFGSATRHRQLVSFARIRR
jgi:TRAP-type mannitol/chloroaromatic compound transport system permease large subunit